MFSTYYLSLTKDSYGHGEDLYLSCSDSIHRDSIYHCSIVRLCYPHGGLITEDYFTNYVLHEVYYRMLDYTGGFDGSYVNYDGFDMNEGGLHQSYDVKYQGTIMMVMDECAKYFTNHSTYSTLDSKILNTLKELYIENSRLRHELDKVEKIKENIIKIDREVECVKKLLGGTSETEIR